MIRFEDVSVSYAGAAEPALRDVRLTVPEGELALLVGPSGSGKSTLLNAVCGLVPHFTGGTLRGRVTVGGRDTRTHPPRELADVVGTVGQDPLAHFVTDTVEEELAYGMESLGLPRDVMRRRVEETLDLLGLAELRDRPIAALSGGQQQRVAIGSVLTPHPRVLVLDEPTSALDPAAAEEVLAVLQRLVHDLGTTVLIAEHRLERVVQYADQVIVLAGPGTPPEAGSPADMMALSPVRPPVVSLGRLAGWSPLPLSVRDARRKAAPLRERLAALAPPAAPGPGGSAATDDAPDPANHTTTDTGHEPTPAPPDAPPTPAAPAAAPGGSAAGGVTSAPARDATGTSSGPGASAASTPLADQTDAPAAGEGAADRRGRLRRWRARPAARPGTAPGAAGAEHAAAPGEAAEPDAARPPSAAAVTAPAQAQTGTRPGGADRGGTAPEAVPGTAAATLARLSVRRGRAEVLRGVTLDVAPGETVALMGRNGAGKSTLLGTLVGLHRPAAGTVRVGDLVPHRARPAELLRRAGLVPQDPRDLLYAETVAAECAAADGDAKAAPGTCRGLVAELLPDVPDDAHPRDLSEGQRLALALAVVLTARPGLLLLDEPTRGLDYAAKARLVGVLRCLAAEGHAVVLATHDVELAAELAHRVVILADGEVVADGPTAEVVVSSPAFAPQVAKILGPAGSGTQAEAPAWLTVSQVRDALKAAA